MSLKNTELTYGSVAKFFHWLLFILILLMLVYGYFLDDFPKSYQPFTYNLHKLIGLTILILMLARALWALCNVKPKLPADTLPWERTAEKTIHFLLYFLIIAMPCAGLIGSVAGGKLPHLGNLKITLPIAQNKTLAELSFSVHNTLALIIICLISVHVLAALYHHFIKKDNVLRRMMPSRRIG